MWFYDKNVFIKQIVSAQNMACKSVLYVFGLQLIYFKIGLNVGGLKNYMIKKYYYYVKLIGIDVVFETFYGVCFENAIIDNLKYSL